MRREFDDLVETLFILHSCDVSHLGAAQILPEDVVAAAAAAMRPPPRLQGAAPGPQPHPSMMVTKLVQPVPPRVPAHQWPPVPSSPQAAPSVAGSRNCLAPSQPVLMPANYTSRHRARALAGPGNGPGSEAISGSGRGGAAVPEEGSCGSIDPRPLYSTMPPAAGALKAAGAHNLDPTHLPTQRWDPASAYTENAGQSELPATQTLQATQEYVPVGPRGRAGTATSSEPAGRQRGRGGLPAKAGADQSGGGAQLEALRAARVCRPWRVPGGGGAQEEVESTLRQVAASGKRQKLLEGSPGIENTPH